VPYPFAFSTKGWVQSPQAQPGALPFSVLCERVGPATSTQAIPRIFNSARPHSFIFTGPDSPDAYQRKLLHAHCSGSETSPRFTGLRWIYRNFSIRFSHDHTLKS
jgi:hypothetical protein